MGIINVCKKMLYFLCHLCYTTMATVYKALGDCPVLKGFT